MERQRIRVSSTGFFPVDLSLLNECHLIARATTFDFLKKGNMPLFHRGGSQAIAPHGIEGSEQVPLFYLHR